MSDYTRLHYLKQHNLKESEQIDTNTVDLNAFLLNEQKINKSATWSKLTKMNKIHKFFVQPYSKTMQLLYQQHQIDRQKRVKLE